MMNSLMINDLGDISADWNGLKLLEEKIKSLKSSYSMFELALNINYDFLQRALKECTQKCVIIRNGHRYGFWERKKDRESGIDAYPHVLVVFVFRSFFENGRGDDFYKPAVSNISTEGYAVKEGDLKRALLEAWGKVFSEDEGLFGQSKKKTRELFCSHCWLIKNFQQNAGNSQLCHAVRYFKNFGDKTLRLHTENYPFDVEQRFGRNFKTLLESPVCRLEREYLIDFADNGTVDNERFAWFEQLDDKSKAVLCELLQVTIDGNVPCFCIPRNYDFGEDNEVDRIVVKFMLRGADASICHFVRRNGRWRYNGDGEHLKQPIWKVTSIIKYEYSNNAIVRTEDILGKALSECCNDERCGAFLINAENARVGIYAPFSRRRILRGKYFAYAFEYSNGNHFEVRRHVKNSANAQLVCVNGNPIGVDRLITAENESIALVFNDVNGKEHSFSFGINQRSPIREDGAHEKFISRQDPNHLFINYKKWPLYNIDADWYYDVDGGLVKGAIGQNCLYKTGRLVFNYGGNQFEEHRVTFVDFSSEKVFERFPVLGIGETKTITLSDCGALNRTYIVGADCTTFGIRLPGGVWQLNVPIRRDGVVFRTGEGDEALSLPFKSGDAVVEKDIAIEDLQKLRCFVYCSDAGEQAAITSMIYCDETECLCHIPLLKDRDGFIFSDKRRYLASRAGRGGDKMVAALLSSQLRVKSFVIEKKRIGDAGKSEAKCCKINLYDPKMEPPAQSPRIDRGAITVELYVPYYTRSCTQKVMKYLTSTGLDSDAGVRELTGFIEQYEQLNNGRWRVNLRKTTMAGDVDNVLRTGASLLAFMADRVNNGADRLISGGFCLLGNEHNLQIVPENWEPVASLHASMHERYGQNAFRLGDMFGMLTLLTWNDHTSICEGRRELVRRISQLMSNINSIGRRADMYMNSLYNTRSDQWSGYIYFGGWYFVEKVYEEMLAQGGEEDGGYPIENCRCLISSTGKRIWSPLMFSRRAYQMTTNLSAKDWWRGYFKQLSGHVAAIGGDYPDGYEESIKPILERVDICLSNGLEDAVNKLHQQIRDWRKDIDTPDIVCDDEAAGCLFCKTQVLRNVLLELSEIDKCFKEEDTTGCAKYLFCDFLKCVDANHWHTNNLF